MSQRIGMEGALIHVTGVSQQLDLDAKRLYSIYHLGIDNTGAANTELVYAQANGAITAVYTAGAGRLLIPSAVAVPVPPNTSRLDLMTASGTVLVQVCVSEKIPFAPVR